MAQKQKELDELEESVLRQQNRTLRLSLRKARQELADLKEEKEETFLAICETETEAERAMRELWVSGYFLDCGPLDYDMIVAGCIDALRVAELSSETD